MNPVTRLPILRSLLARRRKPVIDRDTVELDELIRSLAEAQLADGSGVRVAGTYRLGDDQTDIGVC